MQLAWFLCCGEEWRRDSSREEGGKQAREEKEEQRKEGKRARWGQKFRGEKQLHWGGPWKGDWGKELMSGLLVEMGLVWDSWGSHRYAGPKARKPNASPLPSPG